MIRKRGKLLYMCLNSTLVLLFAVCLLQAASFKSYAADSSAYDSILNSMKSNMNYALKYYEISMPSFQVYNRSPEKPLSTIKAARYRKGSDGIYRSSSVAKDGVATIMLTGDLMCQSKQQKAALDKYGKYEFDDSFTYVKNILSSADFTVGNLETMTSESAPYYMEDEWVDHQPHCNAPSTYLDAVRYAGFDMVTQAHNHDCDTGVKGIFETIAHLDQYKLIHTGLFTNKKEKRYQIIQIDGIKVAFMSYAKYYNDKDIHLTAKGQEVLLNRYSTNRLREDVKHAKADGAEYIITYIHWGNQYVNVQNESQEKCARAMAEAGVDYIIGDHPHALQPYNRIVTSDGRVVPIVYSMGNFVSHMTERDVSMETIILKIELKKNKTGKVVLKSDGYIPCRTMETYKGNNYTVVPLTAPYSNGNNTSLTGEAYAHITKVMSRRLTILGRLSVSNLTIKQSYSTCVYNGNEKKPTVSVYDGTGHLLTRNVDYTVTREDYVLPGLSEIKVKGIGKYCGYRTLTVRIRPAKAANIQLTRQEDSYRLSWNSVVGADGYIVYVKKPGHSYYHEWKLVSSNRCNIYPKGDAGEYSVKVAGYTTTGKGDLVAPLSNSVEYTIR